MKKSFWILLLIFFGASAFLLLHKQTQRSDRSIVVPAQTNTALPDLQMRTVAKSNALIQVPPPFQPQPGGAIADSNKTEVFKQMVEDKNSAVNFYGMVIDQDGNPLSGVDVSVKVRQWYVRSAMNFDFGAHFVQINRQSGATGMFWIAGEKGDGFDMLRIEKPGYELEPMQRSFGAVGGSLDNPVIFKMWKTNIHEQLITGEIKYPIVPDGRIYILSLAQGTIAESGDGDLKVWVQYTNQVTRGQLYDWSAGIEVVNGGLRPSEVYAMFLAPEDGYFPTFRLDQEIKGGAVW